MDSAELSLYTNELDDALYVSTFPCTPPTIVQIHLQQLARHVDLTPSDR